MTELTPRVLQVAVSYGILDGKSALPAPLPSSVGSIFIHNGPKNIPLAVERALHVRGWTTITDPRNLGYFRSVQAYLSNHRDGIDIDWIVIQNTDLEHLTEPRFEDGKMNLVQFPTYTQDSAVWWPTEPRPAALAAALVISVIGIVVPEIARRLRLVAKRIRRDAVKSPRPVFAHGSCVALRFDAAMQAMSDRSPPRLFGEEHYLALMFGTDAFLQDENWLVRHAGGIGSSAKARPRKLEFWRARGIAANLYFAMSPLRARKRRRNSSLRELR